MKKVRLHKAVKKVKFNNRVDVKYYDKYLEKKTKYDSSCKINKSKYIPNNYILGLIVVCLIFFFTIYLTI